MNIHILESSYYTAILHSHTTQPYYTAILHSHMLNVTP